MNITDILNKVLNNKKFIESLFKDDDFDMSLFEYRLGNVLKYYLITNDTNTTYTYPEIESLLERAKSASESMDSKEALDYILSHGYMTHSFNGNKRDIISKYGLSYTNSLTEEEKDKIKRKRLLLNKLEELTKLSPFLSGIDGTKGKTHHHRSGRRLGQGDADEGALRPPLPRGLSRAPHRVPRLCGGLLDARAHVPAR